MAQADSLNRYLYAGDDPVNQVDPSGKDCALSYLVGIASSIVTALGFAGYFGILLISANSGAEIAGLALFLSLVGPSILGSVAIAIGVILAAFSLAQTIQQCGI